MWCTRIKHFKCNTLTSVSTLAYFSVKVRFRNWQIEPTGASQMRRGNQVFSLLRGSTLRAYIAVWLVLSFSCRPKSFVACNRHMLFRTHQERLHSQTFQAWHSLTASILKEMWIISIRIDAENCNVSYLVNF